MTQIKTRSLTQEPGGRNAPGYYTDWRDKEGKRWKRLREMRRGGRGREWGLKHKERNVNRKRETNTESNDPEPWQWKTCSPLNHGNKSVVVDFSCHLWNVSWTLGFAELTSALKLLKKVPDCWLATPKVVALLCRVYFVRLFSFISSIPTQFKPRFSWNPTKLETIKMCRCPTNDKSNSTAWLPVQDVIAGIHSSMDGNRLEMLLKSMQCSDRCCCLNSAQYLARKKKTMLNVVLHKTEIHLTFKIIKKMSTNSFCFVSNSPPYYHHHI